MELGYDNLMCRSAGYPHIAKINGINAKEQIDRK